MKRAASILLLAIAAGAGALAHHLGTLPEVPPRTAKAPQITNGPWTMDRKPVAAIAKTADALLAAFPQDGRPADWGLLDERLAALTAAEFPLLFTELKRRNQLTPIHSWRFTLGDAFMEYWAAADAKGLLALLEKQPESMDHLCVLKSCACREPGAVFACIQRMAAACKEKPEVLAGQVFEELSRHDPAAALSAVVPCLEVSAGTEGPVYWVRNAFKVWVEKDVRAALAFAEKYPASLPTAMEAWLSQDPDAALLWLGNRSGLQLDPETKLKGLARFVQSHPDGAERFRGHFEDSETYYKALAAGMAEKPVGQAAAWIHGLPEETQFAAYVILTEALAARDPKAAAEFCTRVPGLADDLAADHVIQAYAFRDPAGAAHFLESEAIPQVVRERRIGDVMNAWLNLDRAAAMAFLESRPDGEWKGRMLLKASRILTDGDPESAQHYAQSLPDPALRLGASREILASSFSPDKGDAAKTAAQRWAAGISDPEIRQEMEAEITRRWAPAQPDKADSVDSTGEDQNGDPFAEP